MAALLKNGGDQLAEDVEASYCRNLDARWRSPVADESSKSGSLKFDAGDVRMQALWRCMYNGCMNKYYEVRYVSRIDSTVSKDVHTLQVPLDLSVSDPNFPRREPACSFKASSPGRAPGGAGLKIERKGTCSFSDKYNARAELIMVRTEEFLANVTGVEVSSC